MKVLIIYAYPNHSGFNHKILKSVSQHLNSRNEIQILDLYKTDFNPLLNFDANHPRRNLKDNSQMKPFRDLISWADDFLFIFPIWWSGMPAILKGFIDRVFTCGFAYQYHGKRMVGMLSGKKAWIITTCNSPIIFKPFLADYGRVLQRQILRLCGVKPVKLDILYNAEHCRQRSRTNFLERIGKKAGQLL